VESEDASILSDPSFRISTIGAFTSLKVPEKTGSSRKRERKKTVTNLKILTTQNQTLVRGGLEYRYIIKETRAATIAQTSNNTGG
jgi:hypothetical protein